MSPPTDVFVTFMKTSDDARWLASDLSDELLHAPEIYLLIQRPSAGIAVSLERVRLASATQLHRVYSQRLRGVPFEHVGAPALTRRFGPAVDVYPLTITDEWRHVLEEPSLALKALPEVEGAEAALYWSGE